MDHFSTVHTSFIVDFKFTSNITILTGDSGTGKTLAFSFIKECMAVNPKLLCFNYLDYQNDMKDMISKADGKLIVIDNADISLDDRNQYLIIGRNPKNLFATKENLFELVSQKVGEQTKFTIKEYL